ncbi:metal-dependent hydrolase [Sphingomonas crocodyli]|uniref:Metal-dependent hydrolase n=1 Tax=Sphingomonas crocodyli TaxID=1979270 RepID=A0A437M8G3_9SPHN|nr:metal-dependent hydrolase [Sphingomonas crocodyli]RVT93825.1 metal-dependent hydrolase [Sphingomonas crocodyli]
MIVRKPKIDFTDALPHWAPNRAFVQISNATSTGLVPIETYLNKVVTRVADKHGDAALKADAALFCAQEGNHYRQHRAFNKALYGRYPKVRDYEAALNADYDRFLAEKPLVWNAAYCEGFESVGIVYARFLFEEADDLLEGADERLVRLWKWHLAEEFEHRTVCYDVLKAAGGGYVDRIKGLFAAIRHLMAHSRRVADYMLAVDRADMTEAERAASIAEEAEYRARRKKSGQREMLKLLSPFYDPRKKPQPRGSAEYLAAMAN